MQHLPAPKCRRRHYGETSSGEPSPRPHFPRLSSSCAILSRKWGEGAGVSGDAPPHFSPVRRAVTQPRWPRLTEPGRPRQTDAHLGPAAFLGPPSCMLHTRPFPVPSLPVRSRPVPSDCPTELRTSRLCKRSCPLRTRRGRGFDQAAPPYPHRSPPPEMPPRWDIFDVTGL
jgi:hypothetical protein